MWSTTELNHWVGMHFINFSNVQHLSILISGLWTFKRMIQAISIEIIQQCVEFRRISQIFFSVVLCITSSKGKNTKIEEVSFNPQRKTIFELSFPPTSLSHKNQTTIRWFVCCCWFLRIRMRYTHKIINTNADNGLVHTHYLVAINNWSQWTGWEYHEFSVAAQHQAHLKRIYARTQHARTNQR